jgi:hypothetical protein
MEKMRDDQLSRTPSQHGEEVTLYSRMINSAEERLNSYRKLLAELQNSPKPQSANDEITLLLKKAIRIEELGVYRKFYFNQGCYFGLLLIQSQVFENQIKNLIKSCETYIEKSNVVFSYYDYRHLPLNKMTLGQLVDKSLPHYVVYDKLSNSLREFNGFRKSVIHHLTDDYDKQLAELEEQIASHYVYNSYAVIENMILESTNRINLRLAQAASIDDEIFRNIISTMESLSDLKSDDIKFTFDKP